MIGRSRAYVGVCARDAFASSRSRDAGGRQRARACATRIGLEALDSFEVHFFESDVTPAGPVPVASWARYWRALHGGFAGRSRADAWDQFMANSMTFYSPDLTPFVRRLRGEGACV